ncbi:MAG: dATP/dGTP diphosphohydrolase domain-containing protein [Candidatus Kapaibacterium sp.]
MERATRHNEGKLKWTLVSFEALEPMVKVLEFGAKKYEIDNWKKGLYTTEICESMLRHIFAYLNGENLDEDSGLSHIGHIQANAMFLGYMDLKMPAFDDRRQVIANIRLNDEYCKEFIKGLLKEKQALYTEKTYVESMGGAYNPPKDNRPFAPLFDNKKIPKPIIE